MASKIDDYYLILSRNLLMDMYVCVETCICVNIRIFTYFDMGKIYVDVPDELPKNLGIVSIQKFSNHKGFFDYGAKLAVEEEWQ